MRGDPGRLHDRAGQAAGRSGCLSGAARSGKTLPASRAGGLGRESEKRMGDSEVRGGRSGSGGHPG
jgi:hypothetical protein